MAATVPSLVPMLDVFQVADGRQCCVPAFDAGAGRPEFVQAVLEVCREQDSVALFICWAGAARHFGFRAIAALVSALAEEAGVPTALQLDHARNEPDVRAAVEAGFTSVMFDCSGESFEENVSRTRDIVAYAHGERVSVEAAFGAIGREGSGGGHRELTDPELAARFVEETGVDVLAPSVGNVHGCRGHTVPLDWDLVRKLGDRVGVPMALHGGSGVAMEDARRAGTFGFRKLNLATKLHVAYDQAVRAHLRDNPEDGWHRWSAAGREAIKAIAQQYVTELQLQSTATELRKLT